MRSQGRREAAPAPPRRAGSRFRQILLHAQISDDEVLPFLSVLAHEEGKQFVGAVEVVEVHRIKTDVFADEILELAGGDLAQPLKSLERPDGTYSRAKAALAGDPLVGDTRYMGFDQLTEAVFALPERERLELARRIVESVATQRRVDELVADGVRRIEEVVTGEVRGLSEEEYRQTTG